VHVGGPGEGPQIEANLELVRRGFELFNEGDLDALFAEVFHPDVDYSGDPDLSALAGFPAEAHGVEAVRAVWEAFFAIFDEIQLTELDAVPGEGDEVFASAHMITQGGTSEVPIDPRLHFAFEVSAGRWRFLSAKLDRTAAVAALRAWQAGAVVLGRQMADATEAEERHRSRNPALASPLAGVAYDAETGALDLHRWVDSPVDRAVAAFVSAYAEMGQEEAVAARAALTMDDFYTLFAFARRSALASLRGRAEPSLRDGLAAVSAIDLDRVDWRDALVVAELLAWAMATAGRNHTEEFRRVASLQDDAMHEALRPIAERPPAELSPGMWRCVTTRAGPVLVSSNFGPFEPTVDLLGAANAIQDVLEADVYRVHGIAVGGELPPVWLSGHVESALNAIRACVTVSATPAPSPDDQQLLAFIAEAASAEDAAMLASAAVSADWHEALGVSYGAACCVVIANSVVVGVPAFERPGALERFADPVASALREAA
jgi:ketosteroid isomerase-like protein